MHPAANFLRLLVAIVIFAIPLEARAQSEPEGEFTFKRVKPPSKGEKDKINIQVERTWPYRSEAPKADSESDEIPKVASAAPEAQKDDWFWAEISPDIEAADPIRLDRALTALNLNAQEKTKISPSLEVMNRIVAEHGADILLATAGKRVSPAFALAVITVESGGRSKVVSEKGAIGLMQLIPATAQRFDVTDPTDAKQNIRGGVAYLDWLLGKFGGDPILSLAGYNAGENAVVQNKGVPPYAETRAYIPKVVAAWDRARMYCQTVPRFADDGCVFELDRSFSN